MSLQDKPFSVYCKNGFCLAAAEVFSIIDFWKGRHYFMEKKVKMILFMLLGNAILALGTAIFVVPNGLISGGVTGVALILQHFFRYLG